MFVARKLATLDRDAAAAATRLAASLARLADADARAAAAAQAAAAGEQRRAAAEAGLRELRAAHERAGEVRKE